MAVKFMVKCTTCKKVREATEAQTAEARDMGCYFSACCHAVATVEKVHVRKAYSDPRGGPEFDAP